jgi:hypothetical protein
VSEVRTAVCTSATCSFSTTGLKKYQFKELWVTAHQKCKDSQYSLTCNTFAHRQKRPALRGTRPSYSTQQRSPPQQPFQINKALRVYCVQHDRHHATACPTSSMQTRTRDRQQILDILIQFENQRLESLTKPRMRPNHGCNYQRHTCCAVGVNSECWSNFTFLRSPQQHNSVVINGERGINPRTCRQLRHLSCLQGQCYVEQRVYTSDDGGTSAPTFKTTTETQQFKGLITAKS